MNWQPILTAPKDGTRVLLYFGPDTERPGNGEIVLAWWEDDAGNPMEGEPPSHWWWDDGVSGRCEDGSLPTHWLPIPEVPQ